MKNTSEFNETDFFISNFLFIQFSINKNFKYYTFIYYYFSKTAFRTWVKKFSKI